MTTLRSLCLSRRSHGLGVLADDKTQLPLSHLGNAGLTRGDLTKCYGRSILLRVQRQFEATRALLMLDGVARRILLCPPDVTTAQLPAILAAGDVDLALTDADGQIEGLESLVWPHWDSCPSESQLPVIATDWVLFTSGTSGIPKLVLHSLASLAGPIAEGPSGPHQVWSTFYDIRRYGGLQILLRALLGGGSIVFSDPEESLAAFSLRLGAAGVTHISGTPSHWRRMLMSGSATRFNPSYVRLSGETSGQEILNRLRQTYPNAEIAHAFASTEAGVGFEVRDGLAGFPQSLLTETRTAVELRIMDGTLRLRSPRTARAYLGPEGRSLTDPEGFVDTGDMISVRDGRCYFMGRREGIVNVGGLKVHPEEVEQVLNQHPAVLVSRVRGRSSPITGFLVAADVMLHPQEAESQPLDVLKKELVQFCREFLPPHKVPTQIKWIADIPILPSGKVARHHA